MTVFRLITPYAIIMKIASIANPNGYSGIGVELTVKGSQELNTGETAYDKSRAWTVYEPAGNPPATVML